MKVSYSNNKTRKLCENRSDAIKKLGKDVADKLETLLNAIELFPCLYDLRGLPQYRLHSLKGDRRQQYSLTIDRRYKWRLIVYPLDKDGKLLTDNSNEKELLTKTVMVEIAEVSEHYD